MRSSDFPSGWTKVSGPFVVFGYATFRIRCGTEMLVLEVEDIHKARRFMVSREDFDDSVWREIVSDVTLPRWEKVLDRTREIDSIMCMLLATVHGEEFCVVERCPYNRRQDEDRSEPRIMIHSMWKKC